MSTVEICYTVGHCRAAARSMTHDALFSPQHAAAYCNTSHIRVINTRKTTLRSAQRRASVASRHRTIPQRDATSSVCIHLKTSATDFCYDVSVRLSVRLSVTEVHWRIIANLGFKFRSHFTALAAAVLLAVLLAGGSSRAMLASARLPCYCM